MTIFNWFKGKDSTSGKRKKALKFVLYGCTLAGSKQYDDAIPMFKKAIGIDETCAKAHYALGLMYTQQGMNDDAEAAYKKAVKLNPDYKTELEKLGVTSEKEFDIVKELLK